MSDPVFMRMSDGAMMELRVQRNDTREYVPIESLWESTEFRCRLKFKPVGKKADQFKRMDFMEIIPAAPPLPADPNKEDVRGSLQELAALLHGKEIRSLIPDQIVETLCDAIKDLGANRGPDDE